MAMLRSLYADTLVLDDRSPFATFQLPNIHGEFDVHTPKLEFWTQLVVITVAQTFVCLVIAITSYYFIIKRRGTLTAFLIGYGCILPLAASCPFFIIDFFGIRNRAHLVGALIVPTLGIFRCLEAMHGFSPVSVEYSLQNYCLYYGFVAEMEFDAITKKPIQISKHDLIVNAWRVLSQFFLLSIISSILIPYSFEPFETKVEAHTINHSVTDIFSLAHLSNNFVLAVLTFLSLSFGVSATALALNLNGIKTKPAFLNPLLFSKSPTDFWTRWNLSVHRGLKNGIYLPVRQGFSKPIAALSAFFASALFHEYMWKIIFYNHESDEGVSCLRCFYPIVGKQMLFFMWCGLVVLLEYAIGKQPVFRTASRVLPTPIVAFLVTLTALPFSHLFTGDWAKGGYYSDLSLGLLIVRHRS